MPRPATVSLTACAANLSQTTRPGLGDMTELTDTIVESIVTSPTFQSRTPASSEIVLTVGEVENRSSDVFTKGEQWYLMQSVARDIANPIGMGREKNIKFIMPAEHIKDIARRGAVWDGYANDRRPTHVLNGRFDAITRASEEDRQDFFVFEYTIVDLATGETVVNEAVDVAKSATGRLFN